MVDYEFATLRGYLIKKGLTLRNSADGLKKVLLGAEFGGVCIDKIINVFKKDGVVYFSVNNTKRTKTVKAVELKNEYLRRELD